MDQYVIEEQVFDAMVVMIRETNYFDPVEWNSRQVMLSGEGNSALIFRAGFDHDLARSTLSDMDRVILFGIMIETNGPNEDERKRKHLLHEGIIINLFHGQPIQRLTIPGRTHILRGRDDLNAPDTTSRVTLEGYFTYRVEPINPIKIFGDL